MFIKYQIVFITTLISISHIYADGKLRFCAVDGRGSFKRASRYCPILNQPDSKVQCVIGIDRLDCLRKISKNQTDFAVFTSEDLVTARNSDIDVLITNELRFTEDKYEYEVVAVVDKKSKIKSRHDLQDKRFCHPGYGYESDWTRLLSNYLETTVVPQGCDPELTLTENRIKSSSQFFGSACKAGPWVNNSTLDYELKHKYPNLCQSCDNPNKCTKDDKYWGRRGSLFCLTDESGDITWARWDDVKIHFGLDPGSMEASPEGYELLCPDDTVKPINTTNPCVWVVKPWSVVATSRTKAQDIQDIISSLSYDDQNSWQSALLNLMVSYHLSVKALKPIEPIQTYLDKATGFLSANSFTGCHPPRTIKICTTTIPENAKCAWLREAMESYGIEPSIDCLRADNKTHCMDALQKNFADLVVITPDLLNQAKSLYNLTTIFYETVNDDAKYITVPVTKKDRDLNSFKDLNGVKACFPSYDGVAWNTVKYYLNDKNLLDSCPLDKGMTTYFKELCVPELPNQKPSYLSTNCEDNKYAGEDGAIRCLLEDVGDVAFISKNNLKLFLNDSTKNKKNLTIDNFKFVCENSENCLMSWAPLGYVMARKNSTDLWIKDALDVFLSIDDLFGKHYKSLTTAFSLYGSFNGNHNLLFHDGTVRLRTKPTVKNTDRMSKTYEKIIQNRTDICNSSSVSFNVCNSLFILNILFIFVFYKRNY